MAGLFLFGAAFARADVGIVPVSSDYDAEFARAADLLESGQEEKARIVLAEIAQKSGQQAWEARAALLLASNEERRKDFAAAIARLRAARAASIGLEPYRLLLLARALDRAGRTADALLQYRAAFEATEPFAMRPAVGRALAQALEKGGKLRAAADVLAAAQSSASGPEARRIAVERLRLGLLLKNRAAVEAASRALLFAGVDPSELAPASRNALRKEEIRLEPSEQRRLARSLLAFGQFRRAARLLERDSPTLWPAEERSADLLALAKARIGMGQTREAEKTAALVAPDETPADFEARLLRGDLLLSRGDDLSRMAAKGVYAGLAGSGAPASLRATARARLIDLACQAGAFEEALAHARAITRETAGEVSGFESLWKLAWERYRQRDFAAARARLEALADVYRETNRRRRLLYWRARCLEREGRGRDAAVLFESLVSAEPADLYALFARRRTRAARPARPPQVSDPSTATASFRIADELLRLRLFEEAAAEAASLSPSRGKDLRLAEAEFALGRFADAAAAAKRAFPEMGTPAEARVPDALRRLYYPIEEGRFLATDAKERGLDPALLRALVRQESVFDPRAHSRAGALGLTQLMPATARSLTRSVLRVRYRRAFLYEPTVNARLGAAYFRSLLDRFNGNTLFALAAYNGGPTRMARVLAENAGRDEDEIFESHPARETRDYVRRIVLFAESYRDLYPSAPSAR